MKESKLSKMYKIAKILLIGLIMINIFKNCAYAWTYDEFIDFIYENESIVSDTGLRSAITSFKNNKEAIRNKINTLESINNFSSFALSYSNNYLNVYCFKNNTDFSYTCSSSNFGFQHAYGYRIYPTANIWVSSTYNNSSQSQSGSKPVIRFI